MANSEPLRVAIIGTGGVPMICTTQSCADWQKRVQQLRSSDRGQGLRIAANVSLPIAGESSQTTGSSAQPAEQIVITLQAYQDVGLETVICNIQSNKLADYIQQMRLIAEYILPIVSAKKP